MPVNPLRAVGKKSRQYVTSSSHDGRKKSTEKHQPVPEGTTRSISVRIGQFLSERSRTELVHVISTLVLSEWRQILSHRIFNEGYHCHNDSVPIVLTLF